LNATAREQGRVNVLQNVDDSSPGGDMQSDELRLDGNAAGGALRQIYASDVTAALTTCVGCGAVSPVGALLEYGHDMGIVLRCPECSAVLLRAVRSPGWLRVDASGIAVMAIPTGPIEPH
jgi:uncharacterized protein DUF6510